MLLRYPQLWSTCVEISQPWSSCVEMCTTMEYVSWDIHDYEVCKLRYPWLQSMYVEISMTMKYMFELSRFIISVSVPYNIEVDESFHSSILPYKHSQLACLASLLCIWLSHMSHSAITSVIMFYMQYISYCSGN